MKCYCQSCGSPNEYSIIKPTKCIKCNASFAIVPSAPPVTAAQTAPHIHKVNINLGFEDGNDDNSNKKTTKSRRIPRQIIEDEEVYEGQLPEISEADVEIVGAPHRKEKFGDVVTKQRPTGLGPRETVKGKKKTRQQVLDEFKQEAGKTARISIGDDRVED